MSFLPQETIRAKRDGRALSEAAIGEFIAGLVDGRVTESQAAAFCMAVFFRGMSMGERVALTRAMVASGVTMDWSKAGLGGPTLDKHSTGGVGDNVSLMLAPMAAACGGYVPMISGRGLGHTGGTLDKLDSIPGYVSQPDAETFRRVVREVGCAVIGQTADLAPADKRLYAIRDVTATVESIPLITASILSKKLAAGLDGLVMDVKSGSGAFMPTLALSHELAESIATVATGAGLPTVSLITDMNEPLARAAGNALEVRNAVDFLSGARRDPRLLETTLALCAEMLVAGGLAPDLAQARARLTRALESGQAAERFAKMVAALGGPADLMERPEAHLARAPVIRPVASATAGRVLACDARAIGLAVVALGGGRARAQDSIDPAVGFDDLVGLGDHVGPRAPLGVVHAASEEAAERAADALRAAYLVGDAPIPDRGPVRARVAPRAVGSNAGGQAL
jgi:thymidine phosphorylase